MWLLRKGHQVSEYPDPVYRVSVEVTIDHGEGNERGLEVVLQEEFDTEDEAFEYAADLLKGEG